MTNGSNSYVRTFDDELDWKQFDQLHEVCSQISGFCFETKKFCVTTLFVVLTLTVKFTRDRLDHSVFVAGLIISICFWFVDAVGYYYQVKLRGIMETIRLRLAKRNAKQLTEQAPVIDRARVEQPWHKKAFQSGFNHSMWLYAVLVLLDLMLWVVFVKGLIR